MTYKVSSGTLSLCSLTHCVIVDCRLMGLVCSHRVELSKAAPYIVADYCNAVQQTTLYPPVKVSLLSITKLIKLCPRRAQTCTLPRDLEIDPHELETRG